MPYKWTAAAWAEIDSRVIGICAYEERGQGQGLGEEGGMYIVEWASALRRGGLATQMLREARKGWGRGRGRTELQVHTCNVRALRYYRGLGMRRCRWWGEGEREGRRGRQELIGSSLYEPRPGYQMMQVEAGDLEKELQKREALHAPVTGVEYVCVKGVQGLREAGVLAGVRAMVARVYGGEEWYVHDEGGTGRVECLYERGSRGAHEVMFIVARLTGDDEWARRRATRAAGDDGGGGGRQGADGERGSGTAEQAGAAGTAASGRGGGGRKRDRGEGADGEARRGGKRRKGEEGVEVRKGRKRGRGDG